MFVWMSKEHLCVLVYVVTVMHSMQAGYMDKAQKYTEKAFLQIEKLKRKSYLLLQPTNGNNILFFSQWRIIGASWRHFTYFFWSTWFYADWWWVRKAKPSVKLLLQLNSVQRDHRDFWPLIPPSSTLCSVYMQWAWILWTRLKLNSTWPSGYAV